MTHTHIDLCCGLGGWQAPFKDASEWRSIGIDINGDLSPDILGDVQELPIRSDIEATLVTASPPCIEFTKWKLPWFHGGACQGDPSTELIKSCLNAIDVLQPKYWILENVVGCHMYWKPARKHVGPFYFWGDFPAFDAEVVWKDQRLQPKEMRSELSAEIPYHIADSLRRAIEWTI